MKFRFKFFLLFLIIQNSHHLFSKSCNNKCNQDVFGKTFFSLRPQDSNVAQRMVGVIDKVHNVFEDENVALLNVDVSYSQSFNNQKLGKFFSFNGKTEMSFGPICDKYDIYGINIGTTTTGNMRLDPKIRNLILNIDLVNNWDCYLCGLWTRLYFPITYTRWEFDIDVCNKEINSNRFFADLVQTNDNTIDFLNLENSFQGNKTIGLIPPLKHSKVQPKLHDARIAGVHFEIGYDFIRTENNFFAAGLHFVIPTGTRPNGLNLFQPIVGSNHSGQVGFTIQAGKNFWNCNDEKLSIYFDSIITHLFGSRQKRLFGLKIDGKSSPLLRQGFAGQAGSSFLLLKKFASDGSVIGLERAPNILTQEARIKAKIMADLALMIQYDRCNLFSGLGWNFWFRSCEEIENCECPPRIPLNKYAIKGNTLATDNNTESKSTIGTCSAIDPEPVFLKSSDIDTTLALNNNAISNKLFGFFGYNFDCKLEPYLLFEVEVEFAHNNNAIDQWGMMIKGGITF